MSSKYFISIRSAGYILSRLLIAKVEKTTYPNVLHGDFESLLTVITYCCIRSLIFYLFKYTKYLHPQGSSCISHHMRV